MIGDGLGVIFDMDGVLVDSYAAHLESWQRMASRIGRTLTEAQFLRTFGRVSREIIAEHWGADSLSAEEIAAFDHEKESQYRDIVMHDFPAMPGAVKLLRDLHAAGFRLAVGSSGPRENVQLAIDRLDAERHFDARVTGADVTRGKPDPQVFLLAAQRLGLRPECCAVVEDAPVGIEAANAAGMLSIALLSTGHTLDTVQAAHLVVRSLDELDPARLAKLIQARRDEPV